MNCRHCRVPLPHTFLDLGHAPPSNAYLALADLSRAETYYPLRVKVCGQCWLVQTEDYADADKLFSSDYAYFSSTSSSWLAHGKDNVNKIIKELKLSDQSCIIEVASNDGYLLKNSVAAGITCLGIEPRDSTATAAVQLSVNVLGEFFGKALGQQLAAEGNQADLIVGNNVYAHAPDINDFTRGLKAALKPGGSITIEFPHLMQLIGYRQFDTDYHEHFSYLSLHTVYRIFASCDLRIWKVEDLPTHGGSLSIYGCHADDVRETTTSVANLLQEEADRGLQSLQTYQYFQHRAHKIKDDLLTFLIEKKHSGKKDAGYEASAKANTLPNYAGIKPDLIHFVCDAAESKQGKLMPGSHIRILAPRALASYQPACVLILPWNIETEVQQKNTVLRANSVRFLTAAPELTFQ